MLILETAIEENCCMAFSGRSYLNISSCFLRSSVRTSLPDGFICFSLHPPFREAPGTSTADDSFLSATDQLQWLIWFLSIQSYHMRISFSYTAPSPLASVVPYSVTNKHSPFSIALRPSDKPFLCSGRKKSIGNLSLQLIEAASSTPATN